MTLIFDADHTLLDFDADEKRAFQHTFSAFGVPLDEPLMEEYWKLSYALWNEMGLMQVHEPYIQQNYHKIYREYMPKLFQAMPFAEPERAAERFYEELCAGRAQVENALSVVQRLSERYPIAVATNGLSEMQRCRLTPFAPYLKEIFISEEMGCIKPQPEFFAQMRQSLGSCLMIGDSLASDIVGAERAGMQSCWFCRKDWNEPSAHPTYTVRHLEELFSVLEERNKGDRK